MAPTHHPFSNPVLAGVDFSEDSRRALALAAALANALRVPLHVVTAIDPLLNEAAQSEFGPGKFAEDARRDLQRIVDEVAAASRTPVVTAIVGDPAPVLLDSANRADAAITVVGTHGLGRAHRLMFGSTTLRLMRATTRPLLAVPPAGAGEVAPRADALWFDQIVCGVDFGPASETAARAAVALGRAVSAPVTLVHAAGRTAVPQAWTLFAASASERRQHDADARLRELSLAVGEPAPGFEVVPGDTAEVINERATSALIVLGLGGASNQRPGSTAMRVLSAARRPVLTIPV